MLSWFFGFWLTPAFAEDDPNGVATVQLELIHAIGEDHPWGVRLGADWQFAFGDHCGTNESSADCHHATVWPIGGPALSLTWRGGPYFYVGVDLEMGVGGVDMAHQGFAPRWEVMSRVGMRIETQDPAGGLALGGWVSKSFGFTNPSTGQVHGVHGIGLRLDVETGYVFERGWRAATLGFGPWSICSPVTSSWNL